jgi:hypothetical protein
MPRIGACDRSTSVSLVFLTTETLVLQWSVMLPSKVALKDEAWISEDEGVASFSCGEETFGTHIRRHRHAVQGNRFIVSLLETFKEYLHQHSGREIEIQISSVGCGRTSPRAGNRPGKEFEAEKGRAAHEESHPTTNAIDSGPAKCRFLTSPQVQRQVHHSSSSRSPP